MRFDFNLTALIHASNTIWAATANKSATRKEIIQIQFFLSFLLSFFLSFSLFFYHHLHHLSLSLSLFWKIFNPPEKISGGKNQFVLKNAPVTGAVEKLKAPLKVH